jgi:putative ABC transport system permease protein
MLKNYFKIAIRNIFRYKFYSFINIFGLAVGMAVCILIFLYVNEELSFDKFHEKRDRIFRVSREFFDNEGNSNLHLGHVAPAAAPLLKNDFPGILEHAVRVLTDGNSLVVHEDKKLYESIHFADAEFFDVFTFKMLEGDPLTALKEPIQLYLLQELLKECLEMKILWEKQFDTKTKLI